jgi:hypothetical protein
MTNDERKKLYAALSAPFGEDAIERTDGRVTGRGYDTTGIKYQYIVNRLNEVLGIGAWRTEQQVFVRESQTAKGRTAYDATCNLTLQFGEWREGKFLTWAESFATGGHTSMNEADARKGAFTNGLKKAAAMMGCGRQAYEGTLDDDNVPSEGPSTGRVEARPAQPAAPKLVRQEQRPTPKPPPPTQVPPQQRATAKQLTVIWSCVKVLGVDERAFRQDVITRFGAQPEGLAKGVASELIGELTKKANGGRSHRQVAGA